jgi:hypothetical protein
MERRLCRVAVLTVALASSAVAQMRVVGPARVRADERPADLLPCPEGWELVSPTPTSNNLFGITFHPRFGVIAVGDLGTILRSAEGEHWQLVPSPTSATLTSVACTSERCLAVGGSYQLPVMLETRDGMHWSVRPAPAGVTHLYSIAASEHGWVVTADWGILRSDDGETWSAPPGFVYIGSFTTVVYSGGEFLVLDNRNAGVLRSKDGLSWQRLSLQTQLSWAFRAAASDGKTVVVTGDLGALSSRDGKSWRRLTTAYGCSLDTVIWTGTEFLAAGACSTDPGRWGSVWSSQDGSDWKELSGFSIPASSLAWTGSQLVAVGTWGNVSSSDDRGVTWSSQYRRPGLPLSDVIWDGRQFVATGYEGILTSPDGRQWVSRRSGIVHAVCATGKRLVAVDGGILTSEDGESWERRDAGTTATLITVASSGKEVVAAGWLDDGAPTGARTEIIRSIDGLSWEKVEIPTGMKVQRVTWTGSAFLAVGPGTIARSADGRTWDAVDFECAGWAPPYYVPDWSTVAEIGSIAVATGMACQEWSCSGHSASTTSGVWQCDELWLPIAPHNLYTLGNIFLGVGFGGWMNGPAALMWSADGARWSTLQTKVQGSLHAFASNGTVAVAVGSHGLILRNECWASAPARRRLAGE